MGINKIFGPAGLFAPELLAPVGDAERLTAAVRFGADAVYLGGKQFGMRTAPQNFDTDELKEAVRYAHANNVRVYLTCNTLPTNAEVAQLPEFLHYARDAGVDALIVSDIGVLMAAKRQVPELELHISTQAGVVNYLTANELHSLGASRVILARELSLEAIKEIRDKTPPELAIECFVHGAMCVSFSGRCLISNYLTGRDANRGECAQPCRWGYHLVEEKRPGQFYPVFEDEAGTTIMNAQDLCMIEHIRELCAAGISSFKIEGRAKSAYYVSIVTNAYRMAIDGYMADPAGYTTPDWLAAEVRKISHRDYCTGFYFGQPGQHVVGGGEHRGYIRDWQVAAVVTGFADGMLLCEQRNRFFVGDTLEVVAPGARPFEKSIEALYDGDGTPITAAPHPAMALRIPHAAALPVGTLLRGRN